MRKTDRGGVQRVPRQAKPKPRFRLQSPLRKAIEVALVQSVDFVAHDRKTCLSKMNADLVLPPRRGASADEREGFAVSFEPAEHREASERRFSDARVDADCNSHLRAALGDRRIDLERVGWRALADREVLLVHAPSAKILHQRPSNVARSPADHDSRCLSIQAVRWPSLEALAVLPAEQHHQRAVVVPRRGMDGQTRRLIEYQERVVPVQLDQRRGSLGLLRHPPAQAEGEPRTNEARGLELVFAEQALLDDALDASAGQARNLDSQVLVQPPSGVVRFDGELNLDEAVLLLFHLCFGRPLSLPKLAHNVADLLYATAELLEDSSELFLLLIRECGARSRTREHEREVVCVRGDVLQRVVDPVSKALHPRTGA